jgi:hypothetical protein
MLSRIMGCGLALVTGGVLIVSSVFAIPSMVRYARIRAM